MNMHILIPGSVPHTAQEIYKTNLHTLTAGTGYFLLLAGDQRLEHLGADIPHDTTVVESFYPSHMFRIASQGGIPLATQYGLVAHYGTQFPNIPYIIKMTGKTNSLSLDVHDPYSVPLTTIEDIIALQKNTQLTVCGVGISIYIGSMYESAMLEYAARTIIQAQRHGLITIVWIYARGKNLITPHTITPAKLACVAASLGADFVKIVPSLYDADQETAQELRILTSYAEHTGVLCAGGEYTTDIQMLLHRAALYKYKGNARGIAMGRNLILRTLSEAHALCEALKAVIHNKSDSQNAYELYKKLAQK